MTQEDGKISNENRFSFEEWDFVKNNKFLEIIQYNQSKEEEKQHIKIKIDAISGYRTDDALKFSNSLLTSLIFIGTAFIIGILIQTGTGFSIYNIEGFTYVNVIGINIALGILFSVVLIAYLGIAYLWVGSFYLIYNGGEIQLPSINLVKSKFDVLLQFIELDE